MNLSSNHSSVFLSNFFSDSRTGETAILKKQSISLSRNFQVQTREYSESQQSDNESNVQKRGSLTMKKFPEKIINLRPLNKQEAQPVKRSYLNIPPILIPKQSDAWPFEEVRQKVYKQYFRRRSCQCKNCGPLTQQEEGCKWIKYKKPKFQALNGSLEFSQSYQNLKSQQSSPLRSPKKKLSTILRPVMFIKRINMMQRQHSRIQDGSSESPIRLISNTIRMQPSVSELSLNNSPQKEISLISIQPPPSPMNEIANTEEKPGGIKSRKISLILSQFLSKFLEKIILEDEQVQKEPQAQIEFQIDDLEHEQLKSIGEEIKEFYLRPYIKGKKIPKIHQVYKSVMNQIHETHQLKNPFILQITSDSITPLPEIFQIQSQADTCYEKVSFPNHQQNQSLFELNRLLLQKSHSIDQLFVGLSKTVFKNKEQKLGSCTSSNISQFFNPQTDPKITTQSTAYEKPQQLSQLSLQLSMSSFPSFNKIKDSRSLNTSPQFPKIQPQNPLQAYLQLG